MGVLWNLRELGWRLRWGGVLSVRRIDAVLWACDACALEDQDHQRSTATAQEVLAVHIRKLEDRKVSTVFNLAMNSFVQFNSKLRNHEPTFFLSFATAVAVFRFFCKASHDPNRSAHDKRYGKVPSGFKLLIGCRYTFALLSFPVRHTFLPLSTYPHTHAPTLFLLHVYLYAYAGVAQSHV
jgi:hypothetical protein